MWGVERRARRPHHRIRVDLVVAAVMLKSGDVSAATWIRSVSMSKPRRKTKIPAASARQATPSGSPRPLPPPPDAPLAPTEEFLAAAAALGIEFEPGDCERLGWFLAMLLRANEAFNLTAITDPSQAWVRHVLDSLTLMPVLADLPEGSRIIDVGSGGGLPGVPLAIVMPHLRFTLLEATGKKAGFLRDVGARLGLANVEVVAERAERAAAARPRGQAAPGGHREAYDAVVARAVGRLAVVAELTVPFCRVGGRVLLIKGEKAEEELAEATEALSLLRAEVAGVLPTPTGRIVVLEKSSPTPRAYPRADGEPKKAPLGSGR